MFRRGRSITGLCLALAGGAPLARTAVVPRAGPPLLCFPLDIGDAVSLSVGTAGSATPDTKSPKEVVADAVALLRRSDDAVFHVETLRRFVLFSMQQGRPGRATLESLKTRVAEDLLFEAAGDAASRRREALGWLDLGVLDAAGRQAGLVDGDADPRFLEKAARVDPADPGVAFCVALAEFRPGRDGEDARWAGHLVRLASGDAPESVRRNAVATLGIFLDVHDWERLVAEARKRIGRN